MKNEFLRHTLAAIAYRFEKSVQNAKPGFGEFCLGKGSRSPNELINHMFQVLHSATTIVLERRFDETPLEPLDFPGEIARFKKGISAMDSSLSKAELPMNFSKKLLQGPLADILTHVGQIAFLSRFHENPIPGENFAQADIETGM